MWRKPQPHDLSFQILYFMTVKFHWSNNLGFSCFCFCTVRNSPQRSIVASYDHMLSLMKQKLPLQAKLGRGLGSGCCSVGRAVASDTRGPRFEFSHRQLLLNQYFLLTVCRKDENERKRGRKWPIRQRLFLSRDN